MNEIIDLAAQIRHDLEIIHPTMRKTLLKKLPLIIAVMLDARTANTNELAATLPLQTSRQDMRNQWLARLLNNPLLNSQKIMEPFARWILKYAGENKQIIKLTLDQEHLGERFTIYLISISLSEKVFPLIWWIKSEIEPSPKVINIQLRLLEQIKRWLPDQVSVRLIIERPFPGVELFQWVQEHKWQYQFHLSGEMQVILNSNKAHPIIINNLLSEVDKLFFNPISLFKEQITTNLLIWYDPQQNQAETRIMAIDLETSQVLPEITALQSKSGVNWIFAGFRSRGSSLHNTQLQYAIRLDHLILIMSLALYWCNKNSHNYCRILNRKYQT